MTQKNKPKLNKGMKTNRSAAKRFSKTASGLIVFGAKGIVTASATRAVSTTGT